MARVGFRNFQLARNRFTINLFIYNIIELQQQNVHKVLEVYNNIYIIYIYK